MFSLLFRYCAIFMLLKVSNKYSVFFLCISSVVNYGKILEFLETRQEILFLHPLIVTWVLNKCYHNKGCLAIPTATINNHEKLPFADALQNRCTESFCNIHRKTPVLQSLLNNAASLYSCDLIKKTPIQAFSCEYYESFRNSYFKTIWERTLLWLHIKSRCTSTDCFLHNDDIDL